MMKKIGILSINGTLNYGAVLQEYALLTFLTQNGFECELINYINKNIYNAEHMKFKHIKSLKDLIKFLKLSRRFKNKDKKFEKFEKNIKFSSKVLNVDNNVANDYDYIIVGSDQVWNTKITCGDMNFFLKDVNDNTKKKTYAASFGYTNLEGVYGNDIYELLAGFNTLLIREKEPAKYLEKILHRDCYDVLDPTFLLNVEDWKRFVKEPLVKEKYIVVYFPHNKEKCFESIQKLRERDGINYKVIHLSISPRGIKTANNVYDASPEDFLNYIAYASYVIVGSFHGLAFSVIFNKQFYIDDFDKSKKLSGRLLNLMETAGIENRGCSTLTKELVNYEIANKNLEKKKNESINHLLNSIK